MEETIKFIREKDYRYIKDLGNGSFGKTILLKDEELDVLYACKKYAPRFEASTRYFEKFIGEIKILNNMLNENIVRIYNSYIYSKNQTGYIIMEYVDGKNIAEYIKLNPEKIDNIFEQLIKAFKYLEEKHICHRDIRNNNILVTNKGVLKVIDFGFGKEFTLDSAVSDSTKKNNWICDLPDEMMVSEPVYNNLTDMYFLGNLINQIVEENNLKFRYKSIIKKMMKKNPQERYCSFEEILNKLNENDIKQIIVVEEENKEIYHNFVNSLFSIINKIEFSAFIEKDLSRILDKLVEIYNNNSLEEHVLDNKSLVECFVNGDFAYNNVESSFDYDIGMEVHYYAMETKDLLKFINWAKNCEENQKEIIIKNLISRFNRVEKYVENTDDLPF